jgi:hypothetical protein
MYNYTICNADTDSIMFCKPDQSQFSKEEQLALIKEINDLLPTMIKYDSDGIFKTVVVLKAKNYIMQDEKGKIKTKGSSLKSATLEPILKNMIQDIIDCILQDRIGDVKGVYLKYHEMSQNITDIVPWCSKKTLSPTTFNSTRKNEQDIINAIQDTEYKSGDKVYLYTDVQTIELDEEHKRGAKKGQKKTKEVKVLKLKEHFNGSYYKEHYADRVWKTLCKFETVLDLSKMKE